MDIGTKIRNAREYQGYTQQEMALNIPMNQSNYSKIERNLQEPSLFQLKRIAEILQLDLHELLEIDRAPAGQQNARRFLDGVTRLYYSIYPEERP